MAITQSGTSITFNDSTVQTTAAGSFQFSIAYNSGVANSNGTPMVFNSTGSATWTCPTGVTRVKAIVIAGGGGCQNAVGALGGTGGQAIGIYTVVPGTAYAITVGAGGAGTGGGSTANASNGSSSSFSTFATATGGQGGQYAGGSGAQGTNGAGTSGNIANSSNNANATTYAGESEPVIGMMFGGYPRNAISTTTAVVWTPTSSFAPGAIGGGNGAGGVSGAVLIQYIG